VNVTFDCATIQHATASVIEFKTLPPDPSVNPLGIIMAQQNPVPGNQLDPAGDGGLHAEQDFNICASFSVAGDYTPASSSTPSAQVGIAPPSANPITGAFFGFAVHTSSPVYELMSRYNLGGGPVIVTIPLPVFNDGLFHRLKVGRLLGDPIATNGDGTSTAQYTVVVDDGPPLTYTLIVQDDCMIPTLIFDGGTVAGGTALAGVDALMDDYCCLFNDICGGG
jgi:hypothetical protein